MSGELPIWQPSAERIAAANLTRFMHFAATRGAPDGDYTSFYRWSVTEPAAFWQALFDFAEIIADRGTGPVLADADRMPGARWFPGTKLNFAENLLRGPDTAPALIFRNECGTRRELSRPELRAAVRAPRRRDEPGRRRPTTRTAVPRAGVTHDEVGRRGAST